MEVLYWQLAVFGSVAVIRFWGSRKAALLTAVAWTVWSLLMIHTSKLMAIQILAAWVGFFVAESVLRGRRETKDLTEELNRLKEVIAELPRKQQERVTDLVSQGIFRPIDDREHYPFLLRSIDDTNEYLAILSGWVNDFVVNADFVRRMQAALARGVQVDIGFGWQNSRGVHETRPGYQTAISHLTGLSGDYPGQLRIAEFPNHQKILIKDREYIVCGSHNWLSNKQGKNRERSYVIEDDDVIADEVTRVKGLIGKHASTHR